MSAQRPPDQQGAGRPAELTHAEAESLISSRMDGALDPVANRALMAHLTGCPSCRAFATRMDVLSSGLRALPQLPASPTVSRQVRERIEQGPSPWARLLAGLSGGGRWSPAPIAAAAMVFVAALAFVVITQIGGEEGGNRLEAPSSTVVDSRNATETATSDLALAATPTPSEPEDEEIEPTPTATTPNVQVTAPLDEPVEPTMAQTDEEPTIVAPASQPTATATRESAPTETPEPPTATATVEPSATATAEPASTATATPEPTATATLEPTETPQPTEIPATPTAEPTEIPTEEPTASATPTEEPTSTPTEEPTETPEPTSSPTPDPTATATVEPSATATVPPEPTETATLEPTPSATATPEPTITATPEPTATSTPEPTATATAIPTDSLRIVVRDQRQQPVGGACFAVSGPGDVGQVCDNGAGDADDTEGVIEIADLEVGEYALTEATVPEGYVAGDPATAQVEAGAANDVTVELTRTTGTLQVNTIDQNGDPVPDACYDSTNFGEVCDQDADGDMTLTEAPVGDYEVTQTQVPDGYEPSEETTQSATVAEGETAVVEFVVELQPGDVLIEITDEKTEEPVGGACVELVGPDTVEACDDGEGDTDDDEGQIAVAGLPPADYEVSVSDLPEGYDEVDAESVAITAGQQATLALPLPPLPEPTATPTAEPTQTPEPTEGPTEEPTSPPIVQRGDTTAAPVEETEEPDVEETEEVQTTEVTEEATEEPTEEPTVEETEQGIEQTGGDETQTTDVGSAAVTPTPEPTDEPTEEVVAEADLGDAEVIAPLQVAPAVTDAPLAVAPGGGGFAYYVNGSELAVGDFTGGAAPLAASYWPSWSAGGALLFAYPTSTSETGVAVWQGGITLITDGTDDDSTAVSDVPAGWLGDQLYYLRTYSDGSGRVELHRANASGGDDSVVWESDSIDFVGQRPITVPGSGVLIPTSSSWLLITPDGSESTVDGNPYGAIGEAMLSPGGSLIAYVANDQLVVASATQPGTGIWTTLPYPAGGFAWSPSGEQLVVADGSSLSIYTNQGDFVGTVANESGLSVTAPAWDGSGIIFLEAAPSPSIRRIAPDAFAP